MALIWLTPVDDGREKNLGGNTNRLAEGSARLVTAHGTPAVAASTAMAATSRR
ncbi:hypothetical protein QNO09_35650 [Streptomyces sp. 378]|uniref:hypothetical protein n=1 Tax=Streptomyces sp. 378 TaxID=3049412 RepID=UPI0024C2F4C8|nr:hypothetical protein [Streptomyces sp. 378]MDK1348518.1 hypothetical protein [Streptomyces sp. 378]